MTFLSGRDCMGWCSLTRFNSLNIWLFSIFSAKVKKVSHNHPSLTLHLYPFNVRTCPPLTIEHLIELQKKILLMASKVKDIVTN